MNIKYKIGDAVTLQAQDGSTATVHIESIQLSDTGAAVVGFRQKGAAAPHALLGEAFARSVVGEGQTHSDSQLVESLAQPTGTLWLNQLVQVYDRGTNRKVDTGNVTALTRKSVKVNHVEYAFDSYGVLAIG
jgi:hypothetical protein